MKQGRWRMMAVAAAGLMVSACAQFERTPVADRADDDAICRAQGETGSPAYVACRKDRDVANSRMSGNERIERAHRNLAEDMLNNRY